MPARVLTAAACLGHDPGPPEHVARLSTVLDRLHADGRFAAEEAAAASPEALLLRHPSDHVRMLERQASLGQPGGDEVALNPASWPAILGAVGAVFTATDHVLGTGGGAFAAVRPPGHHASTDIAMGFCPVNLVALAAAHARTQGAREVLIIDWDVHHGNGTQAIIEAEPETRFISMHQSPWYPWTGAERETGVGNVRNVPLPGGLERRAYVEALWEGIAGLTDRWTPDLILVSAGFDSLHGDPLGEFSLEPADYATWVGRLRERWPGTGIVGVMEGGYAPERLADGVLATVAALHQ